MGMQYATAALLQGKNILRAGSTCAQKSRQQGQLLADTGRVTKEHPAVEEEEEATVVAKSPKAEKEKARKRHLLVLEFLLRFEQMMLLQRPSHPMCRLR